jgi:diguanylate cyclase (GGDEF)-like protein
MTKALRRWWRQPDHYYWLTAFLASRGAQATTCHIIAASVLGLAVISVAMLGSPAGPHGAHGLLVAMVVAGCCLAMAALWLRQRWPTRRASAFFAVTISGCLAAFCLAQTQPIAGLLGCTAFSALGGYLAFFHTSRFLAANLVVVAGTTGVLAYREAIAGGAVLAVCAAAFVALVNLSGPVICRAVVLVLGIDVLNTEIDQLTGLLNRDAFYRATGELVSARARIDDCYLVIVLITLDNFNLLTGTDGAISGERARVAVAQTLRETTRTNAIVAHVGQAEFLIADTFATTDATPLVERVRGAIATTPPRLTASIGVVATPLRGLADCPPAQLLDELIDLAHAAMAEARRAGGNQARQVICGTPTTLTDVNRWNQTDLDDSW